MYEEGEGHSLNISVDLILTGPPCNTPSDSNCANPDRDALTDTDIANFVSVAC